MWSTKKSYVICKSKKSMLINNHLNKSYYFTKKALIRKLSKGKNQTYVREQGMPWRYGVN